MYLSQKQIDDYQKYGAIIIKGAFKDWIEPLRNGFQKVLDNPSQHGRENVNENEGRFFEDYCNWERIKEFKDCMFNSPAAKIVAEATNSKSIQIFHDHLFIKDPGTNKETPWHQDMPYYCVDGNDTGSFWIPLDNISKDNCLKVLKGSHKLPMLVKPTKWSNDSSWYRNNKNFMDMPNIDKNNIFSTEMNIGDAILFNFKALHSSSGNSDKKSRKAFSARFIGDDVRYIERKGETSPPFAGIDLKPGDKMRNDWFPLVWSN